MKNPVAMVRPNEHPFPWFIMAVNSRKNTEPLLETKNRTLMVRS